MSNTVFKTVQMYCANNALPEVVERSGYIEEQKAFVLDVLRNRTSIREAGAKIGLEKHTALKIFMDICNTLDPIQFPKENPKGMLEPSLDAALQTGKAREILRRNMILTSADLVARFRAFGAPGIIAFSGCGQDSCDEIVAAAAKLAPASDPEPMPKIPSFLQQLEGEDLTPYFIGVDRASGPDKTIFRVKITDPGHVFGMGLAAGMMDSVDKLESLPESLRGVPGFQLALATLRATANAARAEIIGKNLAEIARAGIDVGRHKSVSFDPNSAELICELYGADDV